MQSISNYKFEWIRLLIPFHTVAEKSMLKAEMHACGEFPKYDESDDLGDDPCLDGELYQQFETICAVVSSLFPDRYAYLQNVTLGAGHMILFGLSGVDIGRPFVLVRLCRLSMDLLC